MNAIVRHEIDSEQVALIKATIAKGAGKTGKITIPREVLEDLYVDRGLSSIEIAKILGVSKPVVLRRLRQFGIERRSLREAFSISATHMKNTHLSGENHPSWRGGTRMHTGYLQVMLPEHPEASSDGYVFVHRLVAEEKIGRRLQPNEEVHHINEIRTDNRPENIEVLSKSEHMRLHAHRKHANKLENFGFGRMNHGE